jgi:hypothetical protein
VQDAWPGFGLQVSQQLDCGLSMYRSPHRSGWCARERRRSGSAATGSGLFDLPLDLLDPVSKGGSADYLPV